MEFGLERWSVVAGDHCVDVELERHRGITELLDAIRRLYRVEVIASTPIA
jgi:hypothetical protein